jgi:heterotetrameric sarcosine oxidase gamma subunit
VSAPDPASIGDSTLAAETGSAGVAPAGLELCTGAADIVEIAALRGREPALRALTTDRGFALPAFGRSMVQGGRLALCVRPDRWLLLQARRGADTSAVGWQAASVGCGTAVDLSAGLALLQLCGLAAPAVLARSCRLDLRPEVFTSGSVAATLVAQVATIIVSLPRGLLLLTPATTARHFREWLVATARPFGLANPRAVEAREWLGD